MAADKWLSRFRTLLIGILGCAVGGIASLAFYTSFEAITAYAQRSGGITPEHAWAVPLLVDSFIVVATGADLWFTTTRQQRHLWEVWWPKVLLAGSVSVSFVLNIAHATDADPAFPAARPGLVEAHAVDWAARGVAAIPPAALVLSIELLMMVLRRATTIRAERLQAAVQLKQSPPVETPGGVSTADRVSTAETTIAETTPVVTLSRRVAGELSRPAEPPATKVSSRAASHAESSSRQRRGDRAARGAVRDEMVAFVLAERAAGRAPTGAELDAKWATNNYGSRVLRELAAATNGHRAGPQPAGGNGESAA